MRAYRKEFFDNKFRFHECQQGKQEHLVLKDENLRKTAAEWVRVNAFKKGEPNMTACCFFLYSLKAGEKNLAREMKLKACSAWYTKFV